MTSLEERWHRGPPPARPRTSKGRLVASWFSSTDHKVIGYLYLISSCTFFLVGGVLAMIIRAELLEPGRQLVSNEQFNQMFTIHGTLLVQHWLGAWGMPRRYADYPDLFTTLNQVSSICSFVLGASTLPFFLNIYVTRKKGRKLAVDDPWGSGNSLEWATSCPPPRHNFDAILRIRSERPAFDLHHPRLGTDEALAAAGATKARD
ncbi:cbb3-type cytochrome c oxidase subunit I [Actinomadura graeca]|uniref:Cbb3-type cytochrome c oxidase subunit I n=1 Tax=Actinomadura graeca TaxID=2750812 RepID=A0ABX8QYU4_9ACTN|nr:cbb3-type cytochrome c oxidase subunit I [Actinomadura graeca]